MSTVLTVRQAIALSDCWHLLGVGPLFVVTNGREFLTEAPDERQDREDEEPTEAVLRVWTDHEDAWLYCEQQQENYLTDNTAMRVMTLDLARLFELRGPIVNNSIFDFGVPARADVCTLREGEPVVLDTLWSALATPN